MELREFKTYKVSEKEIEVLQDLSRNFHNGNVHVRFDSLPSVSNLTESEKQVIRQRFLTYGFTDGGDSGTEIISVEGHEYLDYLHNPPLKDYWEEYTAWFKSKRWSIPVLLLVVGVPLLTSWLQIVQWILRLSVGFNLD